MKQLHLLFFLAFSVLLKAQTGFPLGGIVLDSATGAPVEYATVVLKTPDSVVVTHVFSNDKGSFAFAKVNAGKYYLEASFVGYEKLETPILEIKQGTNLPVLKLVKLSSSLKEVNITAIKNAIEFKPGKVVYSVSRDQTNAGLNGLEVLKKIPGVFVDNNDNITVRGKAGIRVYIDDRPSALAVESPAEAIKFFPAGSIESIEVITNPGARYEAAGSGAIINIKLKKEKKMGFNGNSSVGAGSAYEFSGVNKFNGSLNFNIRRNKTNVFVNTSARSDVRRNYTENKRDQNGIWLLSDYHGENQNRNGFVKAGIDIFINDRNTLGISYMLNGNMGGSSGNTRDTNNFQSPFFPTTITHALSDARFTGHTFNVNHVLKTKKAGQEFSFDVTHSILDRNSIDSINSEYNIMGQLSPLQNQYSKLGGHVVSNNAQIDYSLTMKGDAKLEAGVKNTYNGNRSNFNFYNQEQQAWQTDSNRSNKFDYFENVSGAYVQYSNKYHKWEYELGLRGELTHINSNLSNVNQQYANLFPDFQISKKLEENRNIAFSYGWRIDRVPFSMLSNSISYSGRYTGTRGNPNLKPEINNTYTVEFGKQFDGSNDFKVSTMGCSVFGYQSKNSTAYVAEVDTSAVTYITYKNVSSFFSGGADVYAQIAYQRWYSGTLNVAANYTNYNSNSKGVTYTYYMQHNFKVKKKHSFNLNGYYFTRFITPQGYVKGNYQLNAGYRYIFWKENGSLSFNVSDLMRTGKMRYYVTTNSYMVSGVFQTETRYAYLTFQYKFSKGWQGDGKKRTKKNNRDSRLDFENNGGGGLGGGR